MCNRPLFALSYTLSSDESYYIVSGIERGNDTEFAIPAEYLGKLVKEITVSAFENNTTVTKVILPESVTTIGANVFKGCTCLATINIDNTLKSIGNYAFSGTAITNVTIPSSITTIREGVFYNCTKLASVTLHNKVKTIGISAFESCIALTTITLPDTELTIKARAFAKSGLIEQIEISGAFKKIEDEAFMDCKHLTSVFLKKASIKTPSSIGDRVFSGCTAMTGVYIRNINIRIGTDLFAGCSSLQSLLIPFVGRIAGSSGSDNGVLGYLFGTTAFNGATAVVQYYDEEQTQSTTYYIPNSLKEVTVYECKSINCGTFYGCTMLENITLCKQITTIGSNAFYECTGLKELVVLSEDPSTVSQLETIGNNAFYSCTGLEEFMITPNVTTIGDNAFSGCTGLKKLVLQSFITNSPSLTTVGSKAFYGCSELTEIPLPSGLTTIGSEAFSGCSKLTELIIPSTVTTATTTGLLTGCTSLKKLQIPVGEATSFATIFGLSSNSDIPSCLTNITVHNSSFVHDNDSNQLYPKHGLAEEFFKSCVNLTDITIGNGIDYIEYAVFFGCARLKNLVISANVQNINRCLSGCSSLESITIPFVGVNILHGNVNWFNSPCFGALFGSVDYEGSYGTSVPNDYATDYWKSNDKFYIPNSLTKVTVLGGTIKEKAFRNGKSITTFVIGSGVTKIEKDAFSGTKIDTIYLSNTSLQSLSPTAFSKGAKNIYADSWDTWFTSTGAHSLLNSDYQNNLYINGPKVEGELVIPSKYTDLPASAFRGLTGITSVTLPEGLKTIGAYTFAECVNIESIALPSTLESIGDYAFSGLSKIAEIDLGNNLKTLGTYAFSGCTGLTQITIPDGVTEYAQYIFAGCTNLLTISCPAVLASGESIPTTVKYLTVTSGVWSYGQKLPSLVTLTIGDGVTSIAEDLCSGCGELTTVNIGSGLTTWGVGAFANCGKLQSINISASNPNFMVQNGGVYSKDGTKFLLYLRTRNDTEYTIAKGVTEISRYAFSNVTSLKKVVIPSTCKVIGHYAFNNCTSFESATLPSGLLEIWGYAFYNCTSLKDVSLPNSLTMIDGYAFYNCQSITGVLTMSKNLTTLGKYVFTKCSGITEVNVNKKLTTYGYGIFQACNALKTIRYYTPIPADRAIVTTTGVQMIQLTDS